MTRTACERSWHRRGRRSRTAHGAAHLLAALVALDDEGKTAVSCAAEEDHEEVARALLEAGAKVDGACDEGKTPLYKAAGQGHEAVVNVLTKAAGADVNEARDGGGTPLYIAAEGGHEAVVGALISAGADVNKTRDNGRTPLFIAAYEGHEAMVSELACSGCDVSEVRVTFVNELDAGRLRISPLQGCCCWYAGARSGIRRLQFCRLAAVC